jgi:hypothetical protein
MKTTNYTKPATFEDQNFGFDVVIFLPAKLR